MTTVASNGIATAQAATENAPAQAGANPGNGPQPEAKAVKLTLIASELSFATLQTLPVGEVDNLARKFQEKVKKDKDGREDLKDATKAVAKVFCVLEIRLEHGKRNNCFAQNKTLADFIKDVVGEKPPTHALTLKNAFGAFVQSQLMGEDHYDANSNNCLELATRVVTAVKGDLTHDAVRKAVHELKTRTNKEAKNLRAILASVKPVERMDAVEALEMFERIVNDGQLGVCLADLPDYFPDMVESDQRDNYIALIRACERTDIVLGEKVDAWLNEASNATAPIKITAAGVETGAVASPNAAPAAPAPAPRKSRKEKAPVTAPAATELVPA